MKKNFRNILIASRAHPLQLMDLEIKETDNNYVAPFALATRVLALYGRGTQTRVKHHSRKIWLTLRFLRGETQLQKSSTQRRSRQILWNRTRKTSMSRFHPLSLSISKKLQKITRKKTTNRPKNSFANFRKPKCRLDREGKLYLPDFANIQCVVLSNYAQS